VAAVVVVHVAPPVIQVTAAAVAVLQFPPDKVYPVEQAVATVVEVQVLTFD